VASEIVIDRLDPTDLKLLTHLNNQVFRPERDVAFFERRFRNRMNPLVLGARIKDDEVGFLCGMELKPSVFFSWLVGVLPDARRMGVATQLMLAAEDWAREQGYRAVRFECGNRHRAMLSFGVASGYDIIGIRWDVDRSENLVIFEKAIGDPI